MAMATIAANFASILSDMGMSARLIQKKELTDELRDTVFWINIVLGFTIGGIMALASPLIAWAFHEPALQTVLVFMSIAFPLGAAGSSPLALLERTGRFRSIAIVEICSAVTGAGTGIAAAANGFGIMSLILLILVTSALSTLLFWALCGWHPTLRWSYKEFRGLLPFSGNLVGHNIINYFARNADGMLIARFLGPTELGLYNLAYRIMLLPLQNLTDVVNRAFFPVFSGQQHDRTLIGTNYLKLLTFISLITAPLMLGLWAVRDPFVVVALGEKWRDCGALIAWLAPTGYLQSVASTMGLVLMTTGNTRLMRNLAAARSLIYLFAFVLGLSQGTVGVAKAYFFANLITSAISLHYALIEVDLGLLDAARSIFRPLVAALVMASLVFAADHWIIPSNIAPLPRLASLVVLGASLYVLSLTVGAPDLLVEVRRLVLRRSS